MKLHSHFTSQLDTTLLKQAQVQLAPCKQQAKLCLQSENGLVSAVSHYINALSRLSAENLILSTID